ncbi:putative amidase [Cladobotryum mycophilum]|uniref:Amidase n=1 Tax=Cladobotryum mycophilum TaxID=491253 RepID=A0ABR0STX6_9HYPO
METPRETLLFTSAIELGKKLAAGETTSVELVHLHLDQINRHNNQGRRLNAILATLPLEKAIEQAKVLDDERKEGRLRSALHGIPIVLKDNIVTDESLGMPTSAGAAFFARLKAKANASLVDRLLQAGLIILGKTNLTEFCGMKSNDTPMGWSAYGGQTLSAYRREGLADENQPFAAGSSAGSAVSVSAGFSPLAISTETSGSTVYPASAAGVYGIRLTSETVPTSGVQRISSSFDAIGIMARDPADLEPLAAVLQGRETSLLETQDVATEGLDNLSVGVFPSTWGVRSKGQWDSPEVVLVYESAIKKIQEHGSRVVYPLELPEAEVLKQNDETLVTVAYHQFPAMIEEFINCFHHNPEVINLKDIIAWNEKHADIAMPPPRTTQTELIAAAENTMKAETATAVVPELRRLAGPDGMGKLMSEHGLDIVLTASESTVVGYAACAGWPIATVPLAKLHKNGQPYGMFVLAKEETVLLRFMKAWQKAFGAFTPPKLDGAS